MNWWIWTGIGIYIVGVPVAFMVNSQMPYTGGLVLLKSFLWPVAWAISGTPEPMD